jgi:hypothetical protein
VNIIVILKQTPDTKTVIRIAPGNQKIETADRLRDYRRLIHLYTRFYRRSAEPEGTMILHWQEDRMYRVRFFCSGKTPLLC